MVTCWSRGGLLVLVFVVVVLVAVLVVACSMVQMLENFGWQLIGSLWHASGMVFGDLRGHNRTDRSA